MKTKKEYLKFLKDNNFKKTAHRHSIPAWVSIGFHLLIVGLVFVIPTLLLHGMDSSYLYLVIGVVVIAIVLLLIIDSIQTKMLWLRRDIFIGRELIQRAAILGLSKIDHREDELCQELFSYAKNLKQMTPYDKMKLLID